MTYDETIQYLYDRLPVFHHIGGAAYKPGLDNTIRLMNALGNPHTQYKTIHVAGTNGKGSVSHYLAAVLQSAGYKTGLYTSPHLVDFGERIRIDGKKINRDYVVDFVEKNYSLFDKVLPSFFETTMAMAFRYFADEKVDVAVVEVGLGGRLDSTNIIHPDLSVITNIGYDHMQFLGDTLDKIAFEKAGIIKPGIPVVVGEAIPETKPVFLSKAALEDADISFAEDKYKVEFLKHTEEKTEVSAGDGRTFISGLQGIYQLKNLATVLTAVDVLRTTGYAISEEALHRGIEHVVQLTALQGRWQKLNNRPLVICDTGHNTDGIRYVVRQLAERKQKQLHVVLGMVNDKDIRSVLAILPLDAHYYFTNADVPRAMSSSDLYHLAIGYGLKGQAYPQVKEAVNAAIKSASTDDMIFIGGSNFVVGEAIPLFDNEL